jgi:hypothetical protein
MEDQSFQGLIATIVESEGHGHSRLVVTTIDTLKIDAETIVAQTNDPTPSTMAVRKCLANNEKTERRPHYTKALEIVEKSPLRVRQQALVELAMSHLLQPTHRATYSNHCQLHVQSSGRFRIRITAD